MVTRQEVGEGYIRSLGLTYTHHYIKQINKNLLYTTGNSTQYFVITYTVKDFSFYLKKNLYKK